MNSNNQTLSYNEIDLRKIILMLWKDKFLTLIITSIFVVIIKNRLSLLVGFN